MTDIVSILSTLSIIWGLFCTIVIFIVERTRYKVLFSIIGGPVAWFFGIMIFACALAEYLNKR